MKTLICTLALILVFGISSTAQELVTLAVTGLDTLRTHVVHGSIDTITYNSKTVSNKRRALIYTPPGFSKTKKYTVFHIFHGGGQDETGWSSAMGQHDKRIMCLFV